MSILFHFSSDPYWTVKLGDSFSFPLNMYAVAWLFMASYLPVFPQLFFHMVAQRKKVLGGKADKSTAKKEN